MGKSKEECAEAGEGEGGEWDWNSEYWLERAFKDRWEWGEGVGAATQKNQRLLSIPASCVQGRGPES